MQRGVSVSNTSAVLDNPIWNALGAEHAGFAEGDELARRYPPAVTPLAGVRDQSPEAYRALAHLLGPGGKAGLFLDAPPAPTEELTLIHHEPLTQMVCAAEAGAPSAGEATIEQLGAAALPEMIALTMLTEPGPFGPRTPELGSYLGIYQSGRLVAMAGERLRATGYAEVSAVCTHPDHRGRGYAAALVSAIVTGMIARGERPILHVRSARTDAIRVYERLGFVTRRVLNVAVVSVGSSAPPG